MIQDWVKIRTDLIRDTKVCVMADALIDPQGVLADHILTNCGREMCVTRNVMRCATSGALATLWGVTRHAGKRDGVDMVLSKATLSVLDDISGLPGLGEAMASVGWAVVEERGIVFPRFFEDYNVAPGHPDDSQRAKAAIRQKRYRDRKREREKSNVTRNVTRDVTVTPREEERREELHKGDQTREEPARSVIRSLDERTQRELDRWCDWRASQSDRLSLDTITVETIAYAFAQAEADQGPDHVARCVQNAIERNCRNNVPWWEITSEKPRRGVAAESTDWWTEGR